MRKPLASLFAFVVPVAVVAGGCTSSTQGSTPATSGVCQHLFEANAAYTTSCGRSPLLDRESEDRFLLACNAILGAPGAASAAATLDTCASALQSAASSCGGGVPDGCNVTPKGSLPAGQACGHDFQCKSGHCKGAGVSTNESSSGTTTTTSCGVCADPIAAGQPCTFSDECVEGTVCSTSGSGSTTSCIVSRASDVGGSCAAPDTCKTGLVCDFTTSTCMPPLTQGGACTGSYQCASGLACVGERCGAPLQAGSACTSSDQCATGLQCDTSTTSPTCKARTYAGPGQACDATTPCNVGQCSVTTGSGTCPTILADGQACPQPMVGVTCDDGAYCIGGKCTVFDPSVCK